MHFLTYAMQKETETQTRDVSFFVKYNRRYFLS